MDVFHTFLIDIQFLTQLVDDLPRFITPAWNNKAVHFVQRIQSSIARIQNQCDAVLYGIEEDEDLKTETIRMLIYDIRSPLVSLKGYCDLIAYLSPDDPVNLLLNEIDYYVDDMRKAINTHYEQERQQRDN
jgi:hypothetical protein